MEIEAYLATKALLEEVGTTPKPGLVDRFHNGGHTDMDYHTFVASATALEPFFSQMAEVGGAWTNSLQTLFSKVRAIGVGAEQAMLVATGGVNTHKGLLFSAGLLCSVSAYAKRNYHSTDPFLLCSLVADMTFLTLEDEFARIGEKTKKTHGEELFSRYGIRGIRGEVQQGFPSVRLYGLPVYANYLAEGVDPNLARIQTLLNLMAQVQDTNILYRHDEKTLAQVQASSQRILAEGGMFSSKGRHLFSLLDTELSSKKISPGGCADLLGITILLHDLQVLDMQGEGNMATFASYGILEA
ncbi:triphosphoribosyl-dephospho-CoA synthase CitG [uncultured Sphaerochaeta sp.]|uniref:triphosphoribosyl-dephospho-CoA synthase CitG n=1 Tax=uncultured Sphaerochaeta sp. TaxID=886478 RepID=UPI002A0A3862|nr:triphosphoribosyl-dephospho-CoA synthase CitG [uncultured Sphaerochaeta sp.]